MQPATRTWTGGRGSAACAGVPGDSGRGSLLLPPSLLRAACTAGTATDCKCSAAAGVSCSAAVCDRSAAPAAVLSRSICAGLSSAAEDASGGVAADARTAAGSASSDCRGVCTGKLAGLLSTAPTSETGTSSAGAGEAASAGSSRVSGSAVRAVALLCRKVGNRSSGRPKRSVLQWSWC